MLRKVVCSLNDTAGFRVLGDVPFAPADGSSHYSEGSFIQKVEGPIEGRNVLASQHHDI